MSRPETTYARAPGSGRAFADVLCAVDGTRRSYTAVEQAAVFAGPTGRLTLMAVTAVAGAGAYRSAAIDPKRVGWILDRAAQIAERAGVDCERVVDPGGPPSAEILRAASAHELLALGAPAMSWLGGALVGDVAFETMKSFTTPLLMARPPEAARPFAERILVASDGLEESDRVVELAGRLAFELGSTVVLVHGGADSPEQPARLQAQAHELELLLPARSEALLEPADAREAILDVARSREASLIVIGSRRRSSEHPLGSVSRRVVHDAPCSVLLVPPEDPPR
jgi:nucleotide-binding universal stress UspA family protein